VSEPLYEKSYRDEKVHYTLTVDQNRHGEVAFIGKSTIPGTEAFIAMAEELGDVVGDEKLVLIVDLSKMDGAPLRAQMMLGKWLMKNKDRFERIAVFGGKPSEMNLARGIMKIARMDRVGFFNSRDEVDGWLRG
jgi:hypothetical protein